MRAIFKICTFPYLKFSLLQLYPSIQFAYIINGEAAACTTGWSPTATSKAFDVYPLTRTKLCSSRKATWRLSGGTRDLMSREQPPARNPTVCLLQFNETLEDCTSSGLESSLFLSLFFFQNCFGSVLQHAFSFRWIYFFCFWKILSAAC